jgi:Domain of unknown function (DUF2610)
MKRFTIPCNFGETKAPFHIYVGEPSPDIHPLFFQATWLADKRGGTIPSEVMESFKKLQNIAIENNVSFEELCVYALGTADKPAPKAPVAEEPDENA